jgi:hypothetical protein
MVMDHIKVLFQHLFGGGGVSKTQNSTSQTQIRTQTSHIRSRNVNHCAAKFGLKHPLSSSR